VLCRRVGLTALRLNLMSFDLSTLAFAAGVVAFASGLVLLISWWQDRVAWAALWWGVASCGIGSGITMLALNAILPFYVSHVLGPQIISLCAAMTLAATRIFNRGSVKPYPMIVAVSVWIAIVIAIGAAGHEQAAAAMGAGIAGCCYSACAVDFWLARGEQLRGRWPMTFLLGLEAVSLFLVAIGFVSSTPPIPVPPINWFGIIDFVGLVYSAGSAIFLIMMLKERSEAKHKAAARIDPLTGLPNRRAFMNRTQRIFDRTERDQDPISLLAFDLDQFKEINDTFGHPVGDHVLRIFADVLTEALRPADIAGRLGGEEFAAVLPGCSSQAALAIAARIRGAFQDDARFVNGQRVSATVSVGVAMAPGDGNSLADILASADGALYRAKDLGRNRVVLADRATRGSDPQKIVRIA
jgi:diguanylate cyclase (GGDEF)-like protein